MPANKAQSWTTAEDDLLKFNWAGSASKMMALLPGRTRNAIIGRAHRLGIKIPLPTVLPPALRWQPHKERPLPRKRIKPVSKAPKAPTELPPDVWQPLPGIAPVTIWDVEPEHCRWPIGAEFVGFCGCQKAPNNPYCATHAKIAIVRRQW